jgi:hypothetical protein
MQAELRDIRHVPLATTNRMGCAPLAAVDNANVQL